jgi:hypothetical protein
MASPDSNLRDFFFSSFLVTAIWAVVSGYQLYEGRQVGGLREIVGVSELHPTRRGYHVPFVGGGYSGRCEIPTCGNSDRWARVTHTAAIAQVDEAGKILGLQVGGVDILTAEDVAERRRDLVFLAVVLLVFSGIFFMLFKRYDRIKRNRERGTVKGTLTSVETVFDEEPGYLYFQEWASERADQTRIEHFYVTVRLHPGITGDIALTMPSAMSITKLEQYSPALFERLVKGYFSFNKRLRGIAFTRRAKLALLDALAPLPQMATCHRLVARNGRLMLQMSRLFEGDDGQLRQPKEIVLERARIALEALAAEWSSLTLPKRFTW